MSRALVVTHVVTRFQSAGSERNLLNWIHREVNLGWDVSLLYGSESCLNDVPRAVTTRQITRLRRSVDPFADLGAVGEIRGALRALGSQIVHTHQSKAGIVGRAAAQSLGIRTIHTVHMASFGQGYSRPASAAYRTAERACAVRSDWLIGVGEELRLQYLAAGVGVPSRFEVIRSPIDIDAFSRVRAHPPPTHGGAVRVVSIGALEQRKRHQLVIQAIAPMLRAKGGYLDILGDGPCRVPLERFAHALGVGSQVRFLGQVGDVPAALHGSSLLVHASTAEGVPQVVIQALAAGVPVVATDVDGLREIPFAPIAIACRSGADLARLIASAIDSPPPQIELSRLELWRPDRVNLRIDEFLGGLA